MLKNIFVYMLLMLAVTFIGTAIARPETAAEAARQLPAFELMGLPITPVQVQVVGSAHVREQSPAAMLVIAGMPASPHQLAVLTPRPPTAAVPPSTPGSSGMAGTITSAASPAPM
jgi:hypothetical protein